MKKKPKTEVLKHLNVVNTTDYMCFFLIIIITELRCTALTLINIEKNFHSLKKKSDKKLNPEPTACRLLLFHFEAIVAHRQTLRKRIHKQLPHCGLIPI